MLSHATVTSPKSSKTCATPQWAAESKTGCWCRVKETSSVSRWASAPMQGLKPPNSSTYSLPASQRTEACHHHHRGLYSSPQRQSQKCTAAIQGIPGIQISTSDIILGFCEYLLWFTRRSLLTISALRSFHLKNGSFLAVHGPHTLHVLSSPKVSDTSQVSGISRWAGASMTVGGRGGVVCFVHFICSHAGSSWWRSSGHMRAPELGSEISTC